MQSTFVAWYANMNDPPAQIVTHDDESYPYGNREENLILENETSLDWRIFSDNDDDWPFTISIDIGPFQFG